MEFEEREKLIQSYLDAYNRMYVGDMLKLLEDSIHFENYSDEEKTLELWGKQEFEIQAKNALTYFSERKQIAISFDHRENETEVEIDYWAILAIDFPNGMKKGQDLRLKGRSIFCFENGKIRELKDYS